MISLGQKNTLAEYMILSSADNRPPMLDKDMYDSWKSRMELYMQNREHGRMILESVEHCPLIWPTIEENGVIGSKKYAKLSAAEKIQADCDMKETNIILQGLPSDIYSIVNHHRGRHGQSYSGIGYKSNATSSEGNNSSGHARVVECYNCQCERDMARQCSQPKRPRNAAWYKEKAMLAEAQEVGQILDEEQLAYLADLGVPDVFKSKSKEKEDKYMENEINLEKKIKELDNILFKVGESVQTVHMLTKPQAFYDNIHKQPLGYQNPFHLKKAQRIKPTLYDGIVMSDKQVAMPVISDKETLILEEESRSRMSKKEKDQEAIKQNISHRPIDYEKLNRLTEDFWETFYFTTRINKRKKIVDIAAQKPPTNIIVPGIFKLDLEPLAPKLLQNREAHIDYLKYTQEQADILRGIEILVYVQAACHNAINLSAKKVVVTPKNKVKKVRITQTPSKNMKNKVEAQPRNVNKKNHVVEPIRNVDVKQSQLNANSELICATSNVVPSKKTTSHSVETQKPELKVYSRKPKNVKNIGLSKKAKIVESKNANHSEPNYTWGSNATNFTSSSSLVMTGIVRFGNDHIQRIMGYGDFQLGNVTILRVYYVERLGHNLCSVGQFCDGDLEVRFLRSKDEAPEAIIKCIKNIQARLNATIRNVRTDNGAEFVNQTLREFYENVGISHLTSVARTPQHNGIVERRNRTLVEAAHTISGPTLQCTTSATSSSGLVPNIVSQKPCIPPNRDDWDHLFQPMFVQYFNPPTFVVFFIYVAAAPRVVDLTDSPVSMSINQDATSTSIPSTQEQQHSPSISQGAVDPTLFTQKAGNDLLLVKIYVNDIIFASTDTAMCNEFANQMTTKFKMSMVGQMSFFLGLQTSQSPSGIFINQSKYAFEIVKNMDTGMSLTAYADVDHAGCQDTRRSTSGSAQFLGDKLFWNTIKKIGKTDGYNFKLDKKKCRVDTEEFRKILQICPRLPNQDLMELPSEEDLLTFIKELGLDRLRESRAQIMWAMYNQMNVDYVVLPRKDFTYQADNKEISSARNEHMPYLRFTKGIIYHFISKDNTISMRNRINLHTFCDDTMLELIMSVKWNLSFLDWSRNSLRKDMYLNEVFESILLVINEASMKKLDTFKDEYQV
nr:retrovirus-related Pol polyprotein from transposon TNT 1-94 [Tanacetum cinerariifolium]